MIVYLQLLQALPVACAAPEETRRAVQAALVRDDLPDAAAYVRLVLLPTPTAGPFSTKVRFRAPFRSGEAVFEAQCFGIRSD